MGVKTLVSRTLGHLIRSLCRRCCGFSRTICRSLLTLVPRTLVLRVRSLCRRCCGFAVPDTYHEPGVSSSRHKFSKVSHILKISQKYFIQCLDIVYILGTNFPEFPPLFLCSSWHCCKAPREVMRAQTRRPPSRPSSSRRRPWRKVSVLRGRM